MSSSCGTGGSPVQKRSRPIAEDSGTSSTDLHGPQHEMHIAIECATSFEDVQQLLDKGETFCRGDGLNCFVLAVCQSERKTLSQRWDLLMRMLQVDPRGIQVRDQNGMTLLNYFYDSVNMLKQLIELGADLNNVDNFGRTLIHQILCSISWHHYGYTLNWPIWDMLLEHKQIQNQVRTVEFFQEFFCPIKGISPAANGMLFKLIEKGIMSVEELTSKLEMHPLFFIMKLHSTDSFYFLHSIWDNSLDKKENVAALGADLNIVDNKGRNLLECLFRPDVVDSYADSYRLCTAGHVLELWNILIKYEDIQRQACKDGFLSYLLSLSKSISIVRDIFDSIFQLGCLSVDEMTKELKMHPLFSLMKLARGKPSSFLEFLNSHPFLLKDTDITIVTNMDGCSQYVSRRKKFKQMLKIPDMLTFDIFGNTLFTLELSCIKSNDGSEEISENEALMQSLTILLENGFVPCQGVVHPVHALLYNIFLNFENRMPPFYHLAPPEPQQLLDILLKTFTIFKDLPIPHQLVMDAEILDVHLLMSSMLCPALVLDSILMKTLIEFIVTLLQLSPCHPLKHFATLYKYSSCNFKFVKGALFLKAFCMLLRLTLEASGKHRFQGIDQPTLQCISSFCKSVKKFQIQPNEPQEISLHRKAAVKVKSEVGSLQWLSILQIRKTLFLNRSSTTVTLPSLIRGLVADRHLPQGLEADVLVYKPKDCIIKF